MLAVLVLGMTVAFTASAALAYGDKVDYPAPWQAGASSPRGASSPTPPVTANTPQTPTPAPLAKAGGRSVIRSLLDLHYENQH